MSESRPERGAEAKQRRSWRDTNAQNPAPSDAEASREQRSEGPATASDRTAPDQTSTEATNFKATEQHADSVSSQEPRLEDESSRITPSALALPVGGTLGLLVILSFGCVLPLSAILFSTVSPTIKILWMLVTGLFAALTIILIVREGQ